ncbi:MAG TPA: DUF92 domain-containing protein [Chloroflexia bacterium]|nr:DUF92 domain-containing protein [Chloroflexia bacterium]
MIYDLVLALLIAGLIAYAGYRARALTWDGAVAACLVGASVFGFGGLAAAILLVLFFASSSVLSFVGKRNVRKQQAEETFDKGGKRDAAQVLANGGVAAAALVLAGTIGNPIAPLMFGAFVGALAEATADTWATEIGVLSKTPPRLVTTGRRVQAGTSGGLTLLGTGAGVLGAATIGLFAAGSLALFPSLWPFGGGVAQPGLSLILAALAGGAIGMLVDSLLGATLQASYFCPQCSKPTESRLHRCGTPTTLVRGVQWLTNDVVNLAGTFVGASVGLLVVWIA